MEGPCGFLECRHHLVCSRVCPLILMMSLIFIISKMTTKGQRVRKEALLQKVCYYIALQHQRLLEKTVPLESRAY